MRPMRWATLCIVNLALAGCTLLRAPPHPGAPPGPAAPAPAPEAPAATPAPGQAPPEHAPPPRTFHLSAASAALVSQAHAQSAGDAPQATATLERALRIEPDNPLLWIELGKVQLGQQHPAQADAMARKALVLATGDPVAQGAAWQLLAEALRARGRNAEAAAAERRAGAAVPR